MAIRFNHQFISSDMGGGGGGSTGYNSSNNQNLKIQQQQQHIHSQQQTKIVKNESKNNKNLSRLYQTGKQKIMISFYNLYRNYPSEPPPFSSSPIWMMGKCYFNTNNNNHIRKKSIGSGGLFQNLFNSNDQPQQLPVQNNNCCSTDFHQQRFLKDFNELLWFSYRKDFPPIENTSITTDIGWGCMVRTGQMLLAKALIKHFYYDKNNVELTLEQDKFKFNSIYRNIVKWFCDLPSKECVYSIHQIVHNNKLIERIQNLKNKQQQQQQYHNNQRGNNYMDQDEEWNIDEWFSPTKISNVLRQLVNNHNIDNLIMYVPQDGVIYTDYVKNLCTITNNQQQQQLQPQEQQSIPLNNHHFDNHVPSGSMEPEPFQYYNENSQSPQTNSTTTNWKSLIILLPLRLGIDKINDIYLSRVKEILELPQSIGIIGGKPKQSFYFVGYQDDQIIYLDPHFVNDSVTDINHMNFTDSFRYCVPQKMSFSQLDPSLAIGFYCHDQNDFIQLIKSIKQMELKGLPIITVADICPSYHLMENYDYSILSNNNITTNINNNNNNNQKTYQFHMEDDSFTLPNYSKSQNCGKNNDKDFNNNSDRDDDDFDDFTIIN